MQASDLPLLIVFVAAIALLYSIVSILVNSRRRRKYKALFSFVVDKLGHLQIQANALGQIAFKIKNSIVLDYFQSCLNFMQTLSEALTLVSPKGRRPDAFISALVLTKECELRLTKAGELLSAILPESSSVYLKFIGTIERNIKAATFARCRLIGVIFV